MKPKVFIFTLCLFYACSSPAPPVGTGPENTFYRQASNALPANDLLGLSMDAGMADMDQDGDLDIITCNSKGPTFRELSSYGVHVNDGRGFFTLAPSGFFPEGVVGSGFDAEQANFNGDGLPDLYLASRGTVDQLLLGQ